MSKFEKNDPRLLVCDICGVRAARLVRRSRTFGKGAKLMVIENVPMISCRNCGQTYVTSETMHALDRLRLHRDSLAKPRKIDVVEFV